MCPWLKDGGSHMESAALGGEPQLTIISEFAQQPVNLPHNRHMKDQSG